MKKRYYAMTNNPDIFSKVYWGGFSYDASKDSSEMTSIFENRNAFAKKIRSTTSFGPRKIKAIDYTSMKETKIGGSPVIDHLETYETIEGNTIVIVSPYTGYRQDEMDKYFESVGWIKIAPLYTSNATTYMIEIDRSKYTWKEAKYA